MMADRSDSASDFLQTPSVTFISLGRVLSHAHIDSYAIEKQSRFGGKLGKLSQEIAATPWGSARQHRWAGVTVDLAPELPGYHEVNWPRSD
jgi:hypothetical protein